jgi:type II secretory pathway component PulF
MKFKIFYQENRQISEIIIEASNEQSLKINPLFPKNVLTIQKLETSLDKKSTIFRINAQTEIEFINELHMLLSVKIQFFDAINMIFEISQNNSIKIFCKNISNHLANGKNFQTFFEKNHYFFSQISILFFELCDKSGNIEQNINSLHIILNEKMEQSKKIKDALTYPIFLFFVMFLALIAILGFVVPNFKSMLGNVQNLPIMTKIIFFASDNYHILLLSFVGFVILMASIFKFLKTKNNDQLKKKIDHFVLFKIPIISRLVYLHLIRIWFLVLKEQLTSKYKLQESLKFSKIAITNSFFNAKIDELIIGLNYGNSLSKSMKNGNFFDNIAIGLVQTAEETNNYESVFSQLYTINKTKLNEKIKLVVLFIEPIFAMMIALILIIVALGIFVPIWDFANIAKQY